MFSSSSVMFDGSLLPKVRGHSTTYGHFINSVKTDTLSVTSPQNKMRPLLLFGCCQHINKINKYDK